MVVGLCVRGKDGNKETFREGAKRIVCVFEFSKAFRKGIFMKEGVWRCCVRRSAQSGYIQEVHEEEGGLRG